MPSPTDRSISVPVKPTGLVALGFILLCGIWGTSWVAIKYSLFGFPPFLGAALRFLLACAFLAGYARLRSIPLTLPAGSRWMVAVTGLLLYLLDYGLVYWGEQHLSAGVTAIFFSTFPLFTALMTHVYFRSEPFRLPVGVGLLVGFAGVVIVFSQELISTGFDRLAIAAGAAVLAGAASGALSSLLVKKHLQGLHPVSLSLHQMLLGTGGLLVAGIGFGEWSRWRFEAASLAAVIYLGLAASALAFALYYWLLQRLSPITLSLFVYITPGVALAIDWLLLGQQVTARTVTGMMTILAGVLLAQMPRYRGLRRRSRLGG